MHISRTVVYVLIFAVIVGILVLIGVLFVLGQTIYAQGIMGVLQIIVTLFALALSYLILPHLKEIRKAVSGRENYVNRACEIYGSSKNAYAVIEKWEANEKYMKLLYKGPAGKIHFLGPIDENETFLGALARIAIRKKKQNDGDSVLLYHVDRAHLHCKFVVGDSSVLVGQEFGVSSEIHGSDFGYVLKCETEGRGYVKQFIREFNHLLENYGCSAEKRITEITSKRLSEYSDDKVNARMLLENIVVGGNLIEFFRRYNYVAENQIVATFLEILALDERFSVDIENKEIKLAK